MTAEEFRALALALPGSVEGAHGGHADSRREGKIFATLGYPDQAWAMVKLGPDQQAMLIEAESETFIPAKGAWGARGSTLARLDRLDAARAAHALHLAWESLSVRKSSAGARPRP